MADTTKSPRLVDLVEAAIESASITGEPRAAARAVAAWLRSQLWHDAAAQIERELGQ